MKYVSRHQEASVSNKRTRILARCEVRGREVYTSGGQYLGLAENEDHAKLWSRSPEMLRLCDRAAGGHPPTAEEFRLCIEGLIKAA